MTDNNYFNEMVNTSQSLNQAYGYLWWLNGKPSFMVPNLQTVFPGFMTTFPLSHRCSWVLMEKYMFYLWNTIAQ